MKLKKNLIWYSIPVVIGGYLIYKQLSKGKSDNKDTNTKPPAEQDGKQGLAASTVTDFPLLKGKKNNTVSNLQTLLNTALKCQNRALLVVDGNFGTKTEDALFSLSGKRSIVSATELQDLANGLGATCLKSSNVNRIWQLISAQDSGKYAYLMVTKPATFIKVVKDFTGNWVPTSPKTSMTLPIKSNYSLNDYKIRSATNDGRMRLEITTGALAGMYLTDPSVDILKTFNIS
jgi:hypothetical protein